MLDNYIDGKEFMNLSEQEVKKIIPAIGIVKKIMRLIPKVLIICDTVLKVMGCVCNDKKPIS